MEYILQPFPHSPANVQRQQAERHISLEQRAAQHYPHHPSYQKAWLRIISILGDRWLLAKSITRKEIQ